MEGFTGFKFGNTHSSDLGIIRVSGGDRYEETLHPEIKDRTAEVPGLNGEYYFGSDFGPRSFDIEIAFDHLTEEQFRELRQVFGTKKIQKLVFDERPYKYYMVKIESPVELSYICFDEPIRVKFSEEYNVGTIDTGAGAISGEVLTELSDGVRMVDDGNGNRIREKVDPWIYKEEKERVYKGEGKMTFICYFPFAKSNFKVLPNRGNKYYEGSEEWAISSGILSSDDYEQYDTYTNNIVTLNVSDGNNQTQSVSYDGFKIYNPGDLSTGFRLYHPFTASEQLTYDLTISYVDGTNIIHSLKIEGLQKIGDDEGFLINTDNGLIQGITGFSHEQSGNTTYYTTGNIYNRYITAGYFFKLKPNAELKNSNAYVLLKGTNITNPQIFYDYLYF